MNYPEWVDLFFDRKWRALVEQSIRWIDVVIANSEFSAGLFDEMGIKEDRVQVLVGGVDVDRFAPTKNKQLSIRHVLGINEDAYVITTVCRLVAKKGVDFYFGPSRPAKFIYREFAVFAPNNVIE